MNHRTPLRYLLAIESSCDETAAAVVREDGTVLSKRMQFIRGAPDGKAAAIVWSNLETPPQARLVDTADGTVTALPQPADCALSVGQGAGGRRAGRVRRQVCKQHPGRHP